MRSWLPFNNDATSVAVVVCFNFCTRALLATFLEAFPPLDAVIVRAWATATMMVNPLHHFKNDAIVRFRNHDRNIAMAFKFVRRQGVPPSLRRRRVSIPASINRHQQKVWSSAMKESDPESILMLYDREGDRFEGRNLAMAVHRIAKRGGRRLRTDPRFVKLAADCEERVDAMNAQALANTSWALAKTGVATNFFAAVATAAPLRMSEFNAEDMATTAWALAAVGEKAPEFFNELAAQARLDQFTPSFLAMTASAFAKIATTNHVFIDKLCREAMDRGFNEFQPRELASFAEATSSPTIFEAIAKEAIARIHHFEPGDLATIATAFAGHEVLLTAIAEQKVDGIKSRDLAKLASAFATFPRAPIMAALVKEAKHRRFQNAHDLAQTAAAFAVSGVKDTKLFHGLANQALKLPSLSGSALVGLAEAFATAGVANYRLIKAIASQVTDENLTSVDLVTIASSLASLGIFNEPRVFETISDRLRKDLEPRDVARTAVAFAVSAPHLFDKAINIDDHTFAVGDLANVLWAFATARVPAPPDLINAVTGDFSDGSDLAKTAWALAMMSTPRIEVFDAIAKAIITRRCSLTEPSDLARTAWAFACIGWPSREIFVALGAALLPVSMDDLHSDDLRDLGDVAVYVSTRWSIDFPRPPQNIPTQEEEPSKVHRKRRRPEEVEQSELETAVSSMLLQIGWTHDHGVVDGLPNFVCQPERQRGLMITGRSSYIGETLTGAGQFHLRLLRDLGWTVATVSFTEWDLRDHTDLLMEKLETLDVKLWELILPPPKE